MDKDKEIRELNERLTNAQVLLDQSRRTNLSHEAEILQLQNEVSCVYVIFYPWEIDHDWQTVRAGMAIG